MTHFPVASLTRMAAFALAALCTTFAMAHGNKVHQEEAHVHGAGEMEIVLDGKNLLISLHSPLQNVLGFEHSPKTDAERVKARRVVSLFKANGLFAFSPQAQCKRTGHQLISDKLNTQAPSETKAHHGHHDHDSPGGHSDFSASFEFECENPAQLKVIEVRLFRQFPGFEKIDVQALLPGGQKGASLTLKKNTLVVQ